MIKHVRFFYAILVLLLAAVGSAPVRAASGDLLEQDAEAALKALYAKAPGAKTLGDKAKGVLVFPNVTRAGFILGAQGGDGVLFEHGKATAHYRTAAFSAGLQAGIQTYGYALFFMTDDDLAYLKSNSGAGGWSLGVGPTIVIADAGAAKDASTLTGKTGVYGFIFDQKGLMAGLSLAGQKIGKIK